MSFLKNRNLFGNNRFDSEKREREREKPARWISFRNSPFIVCFLTDIWRGIQCTQFTWSKIQNRSTNARRKSQPVAEKLMDSNAEVLHSPLYFLYSSRYDRITFSPLHSPIGNMSKWTTIPTIRQTWHEIVRNLSPSSNLSRVYKQLYLYQVIQY